MIVAKTVGVLCARVRMEEKWMIEALTECGVAARQLPPFSTPLPVGPIPTEPLAAHVASGVAELLPTLVIDRLADRAVAAAIAPVVQSMGARVLDAGLAATGNRYAIASALANAGLPRPSTLLVTSEDAGMDAVKAMGCPTTFLPLDPGAPEIAFFDRDIAEAVLEHREVLGGSPRALGLIQGGAKTAVNRVDILVVGGLAVAASGGTVKSASSELAEAAAAALRAGLLGVTIVESATGLVIWDVQPAPEYRTMTALRGVSAAKAIAEHVAALLNSGQATGDRLIVGEMLVATARGEVGDGVILSA